MMYDKVTLTASAAVKYRISDMPQKALRKLLIDVILKLPEAKALGLTLNKEPDKIRFRQSITGLGSPLKGRVPEMQSIILDRDKVPENTTLIGTDTWTKLNALFVSLKSNVILKEAGIYIRDEVSWFNYSLEDDSEPASLILIFEYYPKEAEARDTQDVKEQQAFNAQKLKNLIDEAIRRKK
jgi:hypothetical protein